MISSFFSKTKPIHYILVLTVLFFLYFIVTIFWSNSEPNVNFIISRLGIATCLLFSVFVVNFIVKRNKLTATNSFAILFYALFMFVYPKTLLDSNAIFCSFFLLLVTRRIISLKSLKEIQYKIFDASLWVVIASLFYDWALLYFILVFVAIYFYVPKNPRNWIIPFVAMVTFMLIGYSILLVCDKIEFIQTHYEFNLNITRIDNMNWEDSIKIFIYFILISFCGIWGFIKLGKTGVGRIITMRLISISFFLGIFLWLFKFDTSAFPIMVTFFPAAVFMTNYIESVKKTRISEILITTAIIVPIGLFIWQVMTL